MTIPVLFIQGAGESTHDQWDNLLVDSLRKELGSGYEIYYPRMPIEAEPSYSRWKKSIATELGNLEDGVILIGHSVGATIIVNAIAAQNPQRILSGIMLLAAPFIGEGGWPSDEIAPRERLGSELPKGVPIYLYHGSADETAPIAHVELYAKAIPQAVVRRLTDRDHQLNNDLSEVASDIKSLR